MTDEKEFKRISIGKHTTSAQGLRHMADALEEADIDGDVELEHFIMIYKSGLTTIGVDIG